MARTHGFTTIVVALALTGAGMDAVANSNGSGTCAVNVVTTPHPTFPSSGNGGFEFSAPAAYMPGMDLQITLTGPITGFEGILLYGIDGAAARVGEWQSLSLDYQIKACGGDALATLTHTNKNVKGVTPVVFTWKAPPAFTETVTFEALVLTGLSSYFNVSGLKIAEAIFLDGFE